MEFTRLTKRFFLKDLQTVAYSKNKKTTHNEGIYFYLTREPIKVQNNNMYVPKIQLNSYYNLSFGRF